MQVSPIISIYESLAPAESRRDEKVIAKVSQPAYITTDVHFLQRAQEAFFRANVIAAQPPHERELYRKLADKTAEYEEKLLAEVAREGDKDSKPDKSERESS